MGWGKTLANYLSNEGEHPKYLKNSNNTMNFKLSVTKFEKKRLSFAFSIAFANSGSSTNTTQKNVSFSMLLSQKVAHFRMSTANKKKAMNTQ